MKQVHIFGAGFAGLTLALRLAEKGAQVHLYEKSSRVGGLLGTTTTDYGLAEQAANALIRTEASVRLFKDLGIEGLSPLESSKKRFIWRKFPKTWPLTVSETLTLIAKIVPKFFFNRNSLFPQNTETLMSWGQKNLGQGATSYLLEPAMQGIYAAEAGKLSSSLILGPVFTKKKTRKTYKGMLTGPEGMQDLVNKLEDKIRRLGVEINLNSQVKIEDLTSENIVLATSMTGAATLLEQHCKALSELLASLPTASLLSATLFYAQNQEKYRGFGCLVPHKEGFNTLGVLFNSYIFTGRNKSYNETWILTGSRELFEKEDTQVLRLIAEERFKLFGLKDALLDYRLHRWENALPLYGTELEAALPKIPALEKSAGIRLHGNYLGGLGLSKILERSEALAEEILA